MVVKLGQLLREQRTRKRLTFEDAARATKIKASFLAAIEKGEYHKLPSPAYAKGFVINYATFLGISRAEVVALFRREFDEKRAYKVLPDSLTKRQSYSKPWIKVQESLFIAGGLIILFVGFLLFQYRFVFIPPHLTVESPKDNAVLSQDITVVGKADSEATVTVNNAMVSLGTNGEFSKQISLFPGKTEIVVKAKNKFGKETIVKRVVTVK
jgi:cytoskeletal protein RodZ